MAKKSDSPPAEMPFDKCGGCYYCHVIDIPGKPYWCFVDPPYPVDTPTGSPASERGALTKAEAPCCGSFKPKVVN